MGNFFSDNLETIMMVAFVVAVALSVYKVYVIFEKQGSDGVDMNTIENEIIEIIYAILQQKKLSQQELFEAIQKHEKFDNERYKNFNLNRYNQILYRLYMKHKVDDYESFQEKI
jgi:hypothetical protein